MVARPRPRRARQLLWAAMVALLSGCLVDGKVKIDYNDQPRALDDGWPVAAPDAMGFEPEALRVAYRRFFSEHEFVSARSLLVFRHGVLVAEGYCRSLADRERLSGLMSATKSVTSLLFGVARRDGLLTDLDQPLCALLGEACSEHVDKRTITLRHLLTMKSGIDFGNDDFSLDMEHGGHEDSVVRILERRSTAEPGARFRYQDADVHLLGAVVQAASGTTLSRLAEQRLFEPLGIRDYYWLAHWDGRTYGPWGLYLRPRDFAKLGELARAGGVFQGKRVLEEAWIQESTSLQTESLGRPHAEGFEYGYYWWVSPARGAFSADGHGGQFAWVQPALGLLIVMTADRDTNYDHGPAIELPEFAELADQIASAIRR